MRTIGLVVVACVISCAYVVNIVEIRGVEGMKRIHMKAQP